LSALTNATKKSCSFLNVPNADLAKILLGLRIIYTLTYLHAYLFAFFLMFGIQVMKPTNKIIIKN